MAAWRVAAWGCAVDLITLQRLEEARALLRRTVPVARRVLGESHEITLRMRYFNALALVYRDPDATLDDLREAIETFEETGQIARRVFGSAHPLTKKNEDALRRKRAVLRLAGAREVLTLEAELAHDIYDHTLVSDADAWAARRELYLQLYRASELAGFPTFITPPPGCGEDEYQLRAELSK